MSFGGLHLFVKATFVHMYKSQNELPKHTWAGLVSFIYIRIQKNSTFQVQWMRLSPLKQYCIRYWEIFFNILGTYRSCRVCCRYWKMILILRILRILNTECSTALCECGKCCNILHHIQVSHVFLGKSNGIYCHLQSTLTILVFFLINLVKFLSPFRAISHPKLAYGHVISSHVLDY